MVRHLIIYIFFILLSPDIFGQFSRGIQCKVVDKRYGEPVSNAGVHIVEIESWATTDTNGNFYIKPTVVPFITVEVSCLGFESYSVRYNSSNLSDSTVVVRLVPISYDMDEVTVLAKNNSGITTTSILGNAAIEHVQPVSLADVMQLIPGNISSNPNLHTVQRASIREIGQENNSSMGTAIFIDGAPVSNNANLQTFSTLRSDNNFTTSVGSGIDLRQISTDNIESVEIMKGIPSVVLGDLTSGAILIKTKAGYTPWEVKLKTDAQIKQVNLGKGFALKSKTGAVNFNLDYLQSFDDLRNKYDGFNRINAEAGFSKVFRRQNRSLTYNAKLSWYATLDDYKTDPDAMVAEEKKISKDRGMRLNMHGKWSPQMSLLTNLDYTFSLSYSHQEAREDRYRSYSGNQAISTTMSEGVNAGFFIPSEQLSYYVVDGKPLSAFIQITAHKLLNISSLLTNKILYGFDYHLDANNGDGEVYDVKNPPFSSSYYSRPRSYKDIPSIKSYSVYLEDKLFMALGKTTLDVQGGVRLNNFQPSGLFKSKLGFYAEPRFAAQYSFLSRKNNQIFDKMAMRIGAGKTYKSPTLYYLYPNKAYFDISVLNYYVGNPSFDTAIFDTRIFDTSNSNLKPSENTKLEAGLVFNINKFSAAITAFYEKLFNGFDFADNYVFINYNRYLTNNIVPGTKPDINTLAKVSAQYPVAYQKPVNNKEAQKSGVEFSFDFGRISSLYTSFELDGAWFRTKRIESTIPYQYQPGSSSANPYSFVGIYPAGESKISERLSTNLRMVTQVPGLRLILSTTAQVIWYDMYYFPVYDKIPMYLVYSDGSTNEFTQEMRKNPDFEKFVSITNAILNRKEIMSPLLQTNFRLSKQIYDNLKLSFYVNNAFNYRPIYEYKRSGTTTKRNPPVYFGAEIRILL